MAVPWVAINHEADVVLLKEFYVYLVKVVMAIDDLGAVELHSKTTSSERV